MIQSRLIRLLRLTSLLYLLILFYNFVRLHLPFAQYPHDWEPTDGDVFNLAERLASGLPIYADWHSGIFLTDYMPLYPILLSVVSRLGLDPVSLGRLLNLIFVVAAFALVFRLGRFLEITKRTSTLYTAGFLSLFFIFLNATHYGFLVNLRTDSLALFTRVAALFLLCVSPWNALLSAFFCVAAFFSHHAGAAVVVGGFFYYLVFNRSYFKQYFLGLIVFSLLIVVPMELLNSGQFLKTVLLNVPHAVHADYLKWSYLEYVFEQYYHNLYWLVGLASVGFVFFLFSKRSAFLLVFLFDLGLQIHGARNTGGGTHYLWFHYLMVCMLAACGVGFIFNLFLSGLKNRTLYLGLNFILIFAMGVCCFDRGHRSLILAKVPDLSNKKETSIRHERTIRSIVIQNPDAKWLANRTAVALVRAGVILDHEMCISDYALSNSKVFNPYPIRKRIADGEYTFLYTRHIHCSRRPSPLNDVLTGCFKPFAKSELIYLGEGAVVDILKYSPEKPECRVIRAEVSRAP